MKCHYEVLGIPRDAEDDVIKKSYRKLALKYHPDKNPENIDEVTKIFHQIQQAYDVLADPQERAWYDNHREAIIKGGLGHGDGYQDNSLDVFMYFNTSCYSGFGDDEKGFYAVYKDVFCHIYDEDSEFMDEQTTENEYPIFGNSTSPYEEVGAFYGFWESYFTAKSYVWVEKYDTREAPMRQIRRLMEQDNKKMREKAKKERNEEVRALVAFVKKRDRRVQAHKKVLEERAAEIKKLAEQRKERDRVERLKKLDNYQETEWSATSEKEIEALEAHLDGGVRNSSSPEEDEAVGEEGEDSEEDLYMDELYCIACNKEFKTDKAFANHEKSKKHRENIALLKAEMQEDDETMQDYFKSHDEGEEQAATPKTKLSKKQKKKRKQQQQMQNQTDSLVEDFENVHLDSSTDAAAKTDETDQTDQTETPAQTTESSEELPPNDQQSGGDEARDENSSIQLDSSATPNEDSSNKGKGEVKQTATGEWLCNMCGVEFPTRNKLFGHIKDSGHAIKVEPGEAAPFLLSQQEKKKGKKKKGKR